MSFHFTSHLNLCEIFSEDEIYSRTDHSIISKVNKYIGTIFHPLNDHGQGMLNSSIKCWTVSIREYSGVPRIARGCLVPVSARQYHGD